jgi:hypothetical protein
MAVVQRLRGRIKARNSVGGYPLICINPVRWSAGRVNGWWRMGFAPPDALCATDERADLVLVDGCNPRSALM